MAKNKNSQKKKKIKSLNQFIGFVIILTVVFFSVFFIEKYFSNKATNDDKYNNFQFYYDENKEFWFTKIQIESIPYSIPFYHHPIELDNIVVEESVEDIILENKPSEIIISVPGDSDSELALAGIEVSKITGERFRVLNIPTSSATNEHVEGLPFTTCADSHQDMIVVSFERSDKNLVRSDGFCIILEFKENEAVRVADAFSYSLLKIM
ncbi:hypothetical protein CMO90_00225 [Candidatus Woesearchaeota archaeon]|jgi:hypothetical protein|nr:hypothetical protein [Candidatus Woesearchaeota archaeon]|tara:strand:+ start:1338 stop:1964 length:627 start_codon:yes stop_codon:yes gene_type:complete